MGASDVPAILAAYHPVILSVGASAETGVAGFLDGSFRVDADQWLAHSDSQAKLDDLVAWGDLIGRLGIVGDSTVVLYDDGEMKFASRVRFLLSHFGVARTFLVNGGWPALSEMVASHSLAGQAGPGAPAARHDVARVTNVPIPMVTRAQVAAELDQPGVTILDVRTPMEFAGTRLLAPVTRGGHIPGAVNVPVGEMFETGSSTTLMGMQGVRAVFAAHHVLPGNKIIVYCQDGAKSSLVATLLEQYGYPSVDLYYLSYADWQADPSSPIER